MSDRVDGPALVLQIEGRPLIYLRPGGELTIGRQKKNDVIVLDRTVSRWHAAIRWSLGEICPTIFDRASIAGVIVNGKKARTHALRHTHDVSLGNFHFLVVYCSHEGDVPTMVLPEWEKGPGALLPELDDSDEIVFFEEFGSSDERRHLKDPHSIHQYLNNLEDDRRTGTLKLYGPHEAKLTFACGKIMRASCGKLRGEAALRHVYALPNATSLFTVACEVGGAQFNVSPCVYLRALREASTRRISSDKRGTSAVLRKIFAEEE